MSHEIESLRTQLAAANAELVRKQARDSQYSNVCCKLSATENEVVQLRQRLFEKDAEIDRLSRSNKSYSNLTKAQESQLTALRNRLYELKCADKTLDSERVANAILTEQLAASQAREQQLLEALEEALPMVPCGSFDAEKLGELAAGGHQTAAMILRHRAAIASAKGGAA